MIMDLYKRLAHLDERMYELTARLDELYGAGAGESAKDFAWQQLGYAYREREFLRSHYTSNLLQWVEEVDVALDQTFAKLREAAKQTWEEIGAVFADMSEKFSEAISDFAKRTAEVQRNRSPRELFVPRAVGAGPIGVAQFRGAEPVNRRPVLPGFMRQKGRG